MGMISVDKRVKMPKPDKSKRGPRYPWRTMEIGDSFLFPADKEYRAACSTAVIAGGRLKKKFSVRTTEEGFRCWRTK
jgi:hypothetical protein